MYPKSTKNNWHCLWGAHKKPPHGTKLVDTCAYATMAPDVPADDTILDHDRLEDHNSDERGDSARRAHPASINLSSSQLVFPSDEEPVTHKHFDDLAYVILIAVGSWVPEPVASLVIQDVPPPRGD